MKHPKKNATEKKHADPGKRYAADRIPNTLKPVLSRIMDLTDDFSRKHLNDDYAALARRMAASLSRRRPSPLAQGKPETWACSILYALGKINFLFDQTQTPHMSARELCELFGVGASTASAKAGSILKILKSGPLDPNYLLPDLMDENPLVWMLEVNGFLIDIREMPREAQAAAFEQGLIPYIPADRNR